MTVNDIAERLGISTPTVTQRARALVAEGKIQPKEGRDWIFSVPEAEMIRDFHGRARVRKAYVKQPPPVESPAPAVRPPSHGGYGVRPWRRVIDEVEDVPAGE